MQFYNAAVDLIDRNLAERPDKTAYIDDKGSYSHAALADRVDRFAGYARDLGIAVEARVLICVWDGIDFPTVCLGAIKAGLVPVMVNPLLPTSDLAYMLADSRARMLVATDAVWPMFAPIVDQQAFLDHIVISGDDGPSGHVSLSRILAEAQPLATPTDTRPDEACLWQYSSGSTGRPKGTIHSHSTVASLMELYPRTVLHLREDDITFSAAKLFFGYGFGNGLIFPLSVGATAILMAERPTPEAVWQRLTTHRPTVFYGVPTLFNSMLASPAAPAPEALRLRLSISAGEALPPDIGRRWHNRYGSPVLNGMGSTEMFHIFLSNRTDDLDYDSTGRPVDGYGLKLVDTEGLTVADGEVGELCVRGPTSAMGYWCNRERTRATFLGEWVKSGDMFHVDADGRYVYCGRSDDLLKVGGIYVSPMEVEGALVTHPSVREAAVVGWADEAGLVKPKAFVVASGPVADEDAFRATLRDHVKATLAPYKYPRWIERVDQLPKTATGKIERYRLRQAPPPR